MKRSFNNILIILFPMLVIPIISYFSRGGIIFGLRNLYTGSIIFDVMIMLILGGYAYLFIVKRWVRDIVFVIIAQIITLLFIFIDVILIYIPIIYNIINDNLVVSLPLSLIIFTTNLLIMLRR